MGKCKDLLLFLCICASVCGCKHPRVMPSEAKMGVRQELEVVVNQLLWVLGPEPGSSARAGCRHLDGLSL